MNNLLFNKYSRILKKYIKNNSNYITEDIIRFIFYKIAISSKICADRNISIEKQYTDFKTKQMIFNTKNNPRLDMYINNINSAIEFKYHNSRNQTTASTTNDFGKLVNDMCRLSTIQNSKIKKYIIYVNDDVMESYFSRIKVNGQYFTDLFFDSNKTITLLEWSKIKNCSSFVDYYFKSIKRTNFSQFAKKHKIQLIYKNNILNYHIKIFKIN